MGLALAGLLAAVVALGQRPGRDRLKRSRPATSCSKRSSTATSRDALEREALLQTVLETMGGRRGGQDG
jgi:hypothetical protein